MIISIDSNRTISIASDTILATIPKAHQDSQEMVGLIEHRKFWHIDSTSQMVINTFGTPTSEESYHSEQVCAWSIDASKVRGHTDEEKSFIDSENGGSFKLGVDDKNSTIQFGKADIQISLPKECIRINTYGRVTKTTSIFRSSSERYTLTTVEILDKYELLNLIGFSLSFQFTDITD